MNLELIQQLRDTCQWVRFNTNKAANFEISIWSHTGCENETIEYRIWIEGLLNKSVSTLEELVNFIPNIKQLCVLSKELAA